MSSARVRMVDIVCVFRWVDNSFGAVRKVGEVQTFANGL
jgi:hypothetical protein